jgi:hypothetical protein
MVSDELSRQMVNVAQDLAHRCIMECASRYNFDGEEAIRELGIGMVRMERKASSKSKSPKVEKVIVAKAAFPLPYNGEMNVSCCYALRQNNGLYTQCSGLRKGESEYCKSCVSQMKKTSAEAPEYGTIQQRQAVGIFSYVDPKGRSPTAYIKVMKKYKLTREQVMEEASKLGMNIDENHFVAPEVDAKRGRPSTKKEVKEKGVKGRPKKEKKVLAIEGDEEDLFASLVAQANEESEDMVIKSNKKVKSEEEKEAERLEKEAKKAAAEQAKKEKEEKLAAEKAEKEAKIAAEKAEREAKKEAERLEKEAKKAAAEQAKKEKEEKLAAEKAAKEAAKKSKTKPEPKSKSKASKAVEEEEEQKEDEEPDVVKKIEFDGKKYLKSKKTGIVYDYNEYVNNQEQVVVGKWNDKTNKIDFENDDGEESEEEYD